VSFKVLLDARGNLSECESFSIVNDFGHAVKLFQKSWQDSAEDIMP
jgi:hypothetical protein